MVLNAITTCTYNEICIPWRISSWSSSGYPVLADPLQPRSALQRFLYPAPSLSLNSNKWFADWTCLSRCTIAIINQKVHKWFNRFPKRLLKWSRSFFGSERNSRFFIEVSSHLSYSAPTLWALKYLSVSHDLTQVASVLPCLGTSRVARQRNVVPKEKKKKTNCNLLNRKSSFLLKTTVLKKENVSFSNIFVIMIYRGNKIPTCREKSFFFRKRQIFVTQSNSRNTSISFNLSPQQGTEFLGRGNEAQLGFGESL